MRIVATESDGQAEQLIAIAAYTRAQLDELAHPEAERYWDISGFVPWNFPGLLFTTDWLCAHR